MCWCSRILLRNRIPFEVCTHAQTPPPSLFASSCSPTLSRQVKAYGAYAGYRDTSITPRQGGKDHETHASVPPYFRINSLHNRQESHSAECDLNGFLTVDSLQSASPGRCSFPQEEELSVYQPYLDSADSPTGLTDRHPSRHTHTHKDAQAQEDETTAYARYVDGVDNSILEYQPFLSRVSGISSAEIRLASDYVCFPFYFKRYRCCCYPEGAWIHCPHSYCMGIVR